MFLKQTCAKVICLFLNNLAYITRTSYSFWGPYEPKKPKKLLNKG